MSLYGNYIKERLNHEIVETENGFATFKHVDSNGTPAVYIMDIYVKQEFRKSREAAGMADAVVKIARERGCKLLIGTVVPSANNSTISLKVLIGYGMSLLSASNDLIVMKKEI